MKKLKFFQAYKAFPTLYTMKKGAFIVAFLLLIPLVFAEINIKQNMDYYNLGDKISVAASVIQDTDVDGFFKASIDCTNHIMQYFVTPISLEKGFRTSINIPDLTVTKNMMGNCKIEAILEASNGTVDAKYTDGFKVENELNISCEPVEAMPGEEVEISCTAKKLSNELLSRGTAELDYGSKEYTANIEGGSFSFTIFIQKYTPSGIQKVSIDVEDNKDNYGDLILEVTVKGIPTKLENIVNKESFKPGETLEIRPVLHDHIGDLINATISLELADSEDKKLISKEIQSNEIISYIFDSFALPGDYKIKSYSERLSKENIVKVESLSKLEMKYSNEKVIVKNIGNIMYNDKTTIVLENEEGKKYLVEKRLKLKPGETKEIDLSKEVPYGNYDIVLPTDSSEKNETKDNIIENVEIHDNRPIHKKAGEVGEAGLGMVTGAAIGTVGFISTRPLAASIILVVIILVIVLFYSRDFIKSRVGSVKVKVDKEEGIHLEKKEGDIEGLFKDFKYDKK